MNAGIAREIAQCRPNYYVDRHHKGLTERGLSAQETLQTDRRTDRRHAIAMPRFALKCIAR